MKVSGSDMADVEGDFKGLSLEDAEEEEVVRLKEPVSGTGESLDNCLVGSFLTSSVVNFVYESHFGECLASYTISDLSDGRFLYRLFHKVDANHIEAGGPWNFNSHLLIL